MGTYTVPRVFFASEKRVFEGTPLPIGRTYHNAKEPKCAFYSYSI